jgi:hypothetical protein
LAALRALENELADPDFLAREDAPSSSIRLAWALDDRYHQANANVATITGITTTSMIAVELIFRGKRLKCARGVVNKERLCTEIKGLAVDQV